jgi:histidine triad (HIT) family protein
MDDCVFCKIVKGELPTHKVYEDGEVIAFNNIEPVADTHILICPKEHIQNVLNISSKFNFTKIIVVIQKLIIEKKMQEGYKLVINGGKYQSVPHLHIHLLSGNLEKNDDILNKL